ncbi:MAG: MCE family protein [Gemmatimonadales bacterium]|nr:MAG: MCE family protein [Gemmatimonadales bacterium]
MKNTANPTTIGIFLIGALVLAIIGVAALAAGAWFEDRETFVSYFSESVNGLERGAPVKFKGVTVGSVTELMIKIDPTDRTATVPVRYEVDVRRLTTGLGTYIALDDPAVLEQQVAAGLRAQLQLESIVTGLLFIELTYRTDPSPPSQAERLAEHPEIPTTPSLLAAFGAEGGSLVAEVLDILGQVNDMLEVIDVADISQAVVASAQAVEALVTSEELQVAIGEIPELAASLGRTLERTEVMVDRLNEAIDPLQVQAEGTLEELGRTLQSARMTLEESRGLISSDTGVGYRLEQALASLAEAAEALRVLAVTLERNPDMLIRGAPPPRR